MNKLTGVVHREYHMAVVERLEQRIAELEAQVPKVVRPVFNIGNFDCPECEYRTLPEPCLYCPGCGAKLDWSEA